MYVYVCMYVYKYVYVCMYVYVYVCMYVYVYVCMYVYKYVYVCMYVCVCMCVLDIDGFNTLWWVSKIQISNNNALKDISGFNTINDVCMYIHAYICTHE